MHETQWRGWNPGGYWYGTNFYAYGLGRSTELAVTNYSSGSPASGEFATGIGFKSAPQLARETHPEREYKLTYGQMLVINHRGQGLGSFTYSHFSFRTPMTHTRLTGGGFFGTAELLKKNTGHAMAGVEQPLFHHRVVLLAEWFGGNHDFGFFIPGVLFHPLPDKRHIFVIGYKIPNKLSNGRQGLVLEYGITF